MEITLKELKKILVTVVIMDIILLPVGILLRTNWLVMIVSLLFGSLFTLANFLLLGSVCEKACRKEPHKAKSYMQFHYALRLLLTAVVIAAAFKLDYLNPVGVIFPMFAPKLTYFTAAVGQTLRSKATGETKSRRETGGSSF